MDHIYWRDADLRTLDDVALISLIGQLDLLLTNRRVSEVPEQLARVGLRLVDSLEELADRARQERLF